MNEKIPKKAIVIGAGIAGLSVAIRLQNEGFQVAVFETNEYPGGKLTDFSKDGYRFDMGPSLFTMPQFVEELFTISKKNIKDYFSYKKKKLFAIISIKMEPLLKLCQMSINLLCLRQKLLMLMKMNL